ncbi:uncharacterized protein LOC130986809 [Salvia miltiorrhiza]|uniref:uncharacterized protein LOC130986809 n=1 Tax=Salvia miltiorrhiza TaxID=226208 RepID=UPI0025ACEC8C|nr:uncharacterized protein LOC130986809 [Salvia miltiorrhiza]
MLGLHLSQERNAASLSFSQLKTLLTTLSLSRSIPAIPSPRPGRSGRQRGRRVELLPLTARGAPRRAPRLKPSTAAVHGVAPTAAVHGVAPSAAVHGVAAGWSASPESRPGVAAGSSGGQWLAGGAPPPTAAVGSKSPAAASPGAAVAVSRRAPTIHHPFSLVLSLTIDMLLELESKKKMSIDG